MTDPDSDGGAREPARPAGPTEPDPAELRIALAHADRLAGGGGHDEVVDDGTDRVLDALERARADLARHGDDLAREAPSMPPSVLAGLDRALAAERAARPSTSPGHIEPGPRVLRFPSLRTRAPVLAAVVVLLVLIAGLAGPAGGTGAPDTPPPRADGPPVAAVPVLAAGDAGDLAVALRTGLGRADYGPLADPSRRAACLGANGVPPGVATVGAREVVFEDRPAVLFVLTTGVAARFRVLVVGAGCGPREPLTLADRDIGR